MPSFRATVRFMDLVGPDPLTVRKALEEQLRIAGVGQWRVLEINEAGAGRGAAVVGGAVQRWRTDRQVAGKLFAVGAALWTLWFLLMLIG